MGMSGAAKTSDGASLDLAVRYEALIRLAEAVRSHPDEKDLFRTFANELHQVIPFHGLSQFDPEANYVHWHFEQGMEALREELAVLLRTIPKEESISRWVFHNQQPVVIRLDDQETRFRLVIDFLRKAGIRSLCALPLSTAHRRLGSLIFTSRLEEAYSSDDQRFLSLVANQIAVAMDDAQSFEASRRTQQQLKLLLEVTNRVVTKLDLADVLQEICASVRQVMQCDGVGLALSESKTGELRLWAKDMPGPEEIIELRKRQAWNPPTWEAELAGDVFRTGKPVRFTKEQLPRIAASGHNSLCLIPLISRDRVLGVLGACSSRDEVFSDDDLRFLSQIANQSALAVENSLAYSQISELKDRLARENVYLESEIRSELHFEEIVGKSEALGHVLKEIETVAPADSTVLIHGETGTGKELIARALHNLSSRKSNAFVKLNCAAIPTGLLESELFGHERGAFTGAISQRVGRFELAHRGTIFLDEIGEIPLELQPKLLRVLQEREFERLGSTRTLHSDARMIAATNRDLKAMVEDQKFRSDLYYRLNVFPIRVPALRERPEDIPLLVRHFVQEFSRRNHRMIETIPSEVMETFVRYHWPGNIRELQNVIERAVIISKGPVLNVPLAELQPDAAKKSTAVKEAGRTNQESLQDRLDNTERSEILRALEAANGIVAGPNGAAARLGIKRSTLQLRMQKYGIRVSRTTLDER
ncbi:MAG TPA: sigma 54-interacting transcriptional regulator [Bryobacteraceae bacterium]|jgi:formate hydrogenlyase transcriptional activator|nr:sigma 54-interacting transcriptional regulator [Bryobacteraceae bacterium]